MNRDRITLVRSERLDTLEADWEKPRDVNDYVEAVGTAKQLAAGDGHTWEIRIGEPTDLENYYQLAEVDPDGEMRFTRAGYDWLERQ
jgi:hypothetical protein